MAIYLDTEIPAVCENSECLGYKSYEDYDIDSIKKDKKGNEYVICYYCGEKIYIWLKKQKNA